MRFLFVSSMEGAAWGGSEELWSRTALHLRQNGHTVSACLAGHQAPRPEVDRLRDAGIELHLRKTSVVSLGARAWARLRRRVPANAVATAQQWMTAWQPDLVCISQGGAVDGVGWMRACIDRHLPYVTIAQANTTCHWPVGHRCDEAIAGYRGAKQAYFVAKRNLELLEDQLGIALPGASIVRNPFNVTPDATPSWPSTQNGWRIACVARLDPGAKGQDLLLHALSDPRWKTRPLHVRFFGRGSYESNLRRLAERLRLTNIEFTGYVHDIDALWSDHHALILPSRYEGLPLALVEAMWCGRTAIVTDVDGNSELIEDGVQGFLAPAATAGFVGEALERAWQARERWQEMGVAARERVRAVIPRDPIATFATELLRVAGSPPPPREANAVAAGVGG